MNVPEACGGRGRTRETNEMSEKPGGREVRREIYVEASPETVFALLRCDRDKEMAGRNRRCRSRSGWRLSPGRIRRNANQRSLRRGCALLQSRFYLGW